MSELLEFQMGAYIDTDMYPTKAAQDKARVKAYRYFLRHGEEGVDGVRLVGRWRNPDRKSGEDWRKTTDAGQSIEDFHKTLHGQRGALRDLARKYGV